jgi:hypothetical protein
MPGTVNSTNEKNSRLKSVAALVPVVVGVCSLLFAGWQYVERRDADRELRDLQVRAQRYENMVARAKNAARVDDCYLNVAGDLLYGRLLDKNRAPGTGFSIEALAAPPPRKVSQRRFDAALIAVTEDLRKSMRWDGDLKLARTPIVDDVMTMLDTGVRIQDLRFLVLRNEGLYELGDVQIDTSMATSVWNRDLGDWETKSQPYRIQLGAMAPGNAVAVCIGAYPTLQGSVDAMKDGRPTSRELVPQMDESRRSKVTFTDQLTDRRSSRLIRDEYRDTTLYISPFVQAGG